MSNPKHGHGRLRWKGDKLYLGRKPTGFQVVPDLKYPGVMWRVRYPDGRLTDMVNKPRAKDAAQTLALAVLNSVPDMSESGDVPSLVR